MPSTAESPDRWAQLFNFTYLVIAMTSLNIEAIYTKQDEQVPGYLVAIFKTNQGLYQVGYGHFDKLQDINLNEFFENDLVERLKRKYDLLEIVDSRVTSDNDMHFLISNKFILVLGFTLSSTTEYSINEFWIEEDIYGANGNALTNFFELDKVTLPT